MGRELAGGFSTVLHIMDIWKIKVVNSVLETRRSRCGLSLLFVKGSRIDTGRRLFAQVSFYAVILRV